MEYLRLYQEKYGLTLTPAAVSNLVDTKLPQRLIRNPEERILISNGSAVVSIQPDSEILEQLRRRTVLDMEEIGADKKTPAYGLCSFFLADGDSFFRLEQLEQGCLEIRRRGEAQEVLWQEYLPHLELEVNRNGVFDNIELIGEAYRRQNISTFLLEEVEIPVSNGTVIFPVNGEKQYDLPLSREVYGRHSREKLARFKLLEPLKQDTKVELTVYYRYGNIDSYKLIARSQELDAPLESVWCDQTEQMENLAPSFQPRTIEFKEEDFKKVYRAFRALSENVTGIDRPPRTYYGAVYENPKDSGRFYSKYMFDLNGWGPPYFHIQNFFKKEAFSVSKPLISDLLRRGVFGYVAQVLRGELPRGHDLGIDMHYGQDESRIMIRNMASIACNFGCFFALRDASSDQTRVHDTIEGILEYYRRQKRLRLQDWAPISKYILREQDSHGIWKDFSEALQELDPKDPISTMYALRSISGVCYQTENWIFEFYHGPNGPQEVEWILKNILAVLDCEECISPKTGERKYNPRKIRDVLELLLCICRLKREDPSILDCNTHEVRKLVKRLKEIDRRMREMEEQNRLKKPFNSRLGIESPEAYNRVNPVIYALIQTLTGGKPVNLIGFTPDL